MRMRTALVLTIAVVAAVANPATQKPARPMQEWGSYAADPGATHYSPLADLDRQSVGQLRPAWEWKPAEDALAEYGTRPGMFENTPLMIDNGLSLSPPYNRVVALNAETGPELWSYDPKAYVAGQPPNGTGFVHRGVATWTDGKQRRVFINSRWKLIALDAATGRPIPGFGDTGVVDLTRQLKRNGKEVNKLHYTQ